MIHLLLLLATLAQGMRPKIQSMLQLTPPDATCTQWLGSPAGQEFLTCESGDPGVPVSYLQYNNQTNTSTCQLTSDDFSAYCNNSCYFSVVKALTFFLNTSICLPVYEDMYKPCVNNSDCNMATLGAQPPRVCHEGFCYTACINDTGCNQCQGETCVQMDGNSSACVSNQTYFVNGSALVNRTIQNTFRGYLYSLQAICAMANNTQTNNTNNTNNNTNTTQPLNTTQTFIPNRYCGLIMVNLTNYQNQTNQTEACESLERDWGCCATTVFGSMKYCQWQNFTSSNSTNSTNFLNCNFTSPPCADLPLAWQFCSYNVTNSTNNSSSSSSSSSSSGSSSSSSSSGIIINNSSSSSGIFNSNLSSSSSGSMSSSSHSSSLNNTNNNGNGTGSGVADSRPISWSVTVALILAVAHMVS